MWALTSQLVLPYLLLISTPVLAAPFSKISSRPPTNMTYLQSRDRYILRNDTLSGQLIAINPNTLQPVPQGLSTDGSGQSFNAPAVIWIALVLAVGIPLSFAGLRGLRLTSGVGVGLVVILPGKPAFLIFLWFPNNKITQYGRRSSTPWGQREYRIYCSHCSALQCLLSDSLSGFLKLASGQGWSRSEFQAVWVWVSVLCYLGLACCSQLVITAMVLAMF